MAGDETKGIAYVEVPRERAEAIQADAQRSVVRLAAPHEGLVEEYANQMLDGLWSFDPKPVTFRR